MPKKSSNKLNNSRMKMEVASEFDDNSNARARNASVGGESSQSSRCNSNSRSNCSSRTSCKSNARKCR